MHFLRLSKLVHWPQMFIKRFSSIFISVSASFACMNSGTSIGMWNHLGKLTEGSKSDTGDGHFEKGLCCGVFLVNLAQEVMV